MYIKWIVCNVKADKRLAFSDAQEKWNETTKSDGFIAQVGGWNLNAENEACVISIWENKKTLNNFMKNVHDKIFEGNKQDETYESINITFFDSKFKLNNNFKSLKKSIHFSKLLQITICKTEDDKNVPFEKNQKLIWESKIEQLQDISGVIFSKKVNDSSTYLVSSFWNTDSSNKYIENKKQINSKKISINNAAEPVIEKQILLVDSWGIVK